MVDSTDAVRGDAGRAPLRRGAFGMVAALGNPLGFAGVDADRMLGELAGLVAPEGCLLLELVCGPGERSRYLARLPPGAVGRLFSAPVNLVRSRADREGYERLTEVRKEGSSFRRYAPAEIDQWLTRRGFSVAETMAVAPALGGDPERVRAVRSDPRAWLRLLELEEQLGRSTARQVHASAVLVAARRRSPGASGVGAAGAGPTPHQSD
jgi:hypothetical protein